MPQQGRVAIVVQRDDVVAFLTASIDLLLHGIGRPLPGNGRRHTVRDAGHLFQGCHRCGQDPSGGSVLGDQPVKKQVADTGDTFEGEPR